MKRLARVGAHRGLIVVMAVVLAALVLVAGCGSTGRQGSAAESNRSAELTPGEFPDATPPAPTPPPPAMLKDPKKSVYSYLLWISYAYRILDSNVATHTFSEWEEVRVNSYVEFNRQQGRAIDQRLVDFRVESVDPVDWTDETTVTVTARETWRYRYIDTKSVKYNTPAYSETYDTVYTVVNVPEKGWLVDKVKASSLSGQPK